MSAGSEHMSVACRGVCYMYMVGLPPSWDVSLVLLDEASLLFEFAVAFFFCALIGEPGVTPFLSIALQACCSAHATIP